MYKRECPKCQKEIIYQSNSGFWNGNHKNSVCRRCASIASGFTGKYATKGKNCGKDNHFYGKKHSKVTKKLMSKSQLSRDWSSYQTSEFKAKQSKLNSGVNNSMYGKTVHDTWVEKYGKVEADRLEKIRKKKLSKIFSGKNNPMYGKPTPQGSGNGWKGWYKKFFFRSLRELCYIIELDANNIAWSTGETISIEYIKPTGDIGTYKPDFIVGNAIVEVKPKRLHNTPTVKAKYKALKKYCKKNNLIPVLIDQDINIKLIRLNIDNGNIKFYGNYLQRFEKYEKANCS